MIFLYILIFLVVLVGVTLLLYFLLRPSPSKSDYTSLEEPKNETSVEEEDDEASE